jgi:hypothetical protein
MLRCWQLLLNSLQIQFRGFERRVSEPVAHSSDVDPSWEPAIGSGVAEAVQEEIVRILLPILRSLLQDSNDVPLHLRFLIAKHQRRTVATRSRLMESVRYFCGNGTSRFLLPFGVKPGFARTWKMRPCKSRSVHSHVVISRSRAQVIKENFQYSCSSSVLAVSSAFKCSGVCGPRLVPVSPLCFGFCDPSPISATRLTP